MQWLGKERGMQLQVVLAGGVNLANSGRRTNDGELVEFSDHHAGDKTRERDPIGTSMRARRQAWRDKGW